MKKLSVLFSSFILMMAFQNCGGQKLAFQDTGTADLGSLGVCSGISCDLTPLTTTPAVTTILMALGDEANDQLVVNGASSQLIAETVVRYSSPVTNPKILLVRDSNSGIESSSDTLYVKNTLLARYNVTYYEEPTTGLKDSDLAGYDLIWFNNPGQPMGSVNSRDALINFKGGVVLEGDDLSHSAGNFSLQDLTGLTYVDNGTTVVCDGVTYNHDDNNGYQYRVSLDSTKIPGANASTIHFNYGNDIDNTTVARADLEILAYAQGGPTSCTATRPAIVRYLK